MVVVVGENNNYLLMLALNQKAKSFAQTNFTASANGLSISRMAQLRD